MVERRPTSHAERRETLPSAEVEITHESKELQPVSKTRRLWNGFKDTFFSATNRNNFKNSVAAVAERLLPLGDTTFSNKFGANYWEELAKDPAPPATVEPNAPQKLKSAPPKKPSRIMGKFTDAANSFISFVSLGEAPQIGTDYWAKYVNYLEKFDEFENNQGEEKIDITEEMTKLTENNIESLDEKNLTNKPVEQLAETWTQQEMLDIVEQTEIRAEEKAQQIHDATTQALDELNQRIETLRKISALKDNRHERLLAKIAKLQVKTQEAGTKAQKAFEKNAVDFKKIETELKAAATKLEAQIKSTNTDTATKNALSKDKEPPTSTKKEIVDNGVSAEFEGRKIVYEYFNRLMKLGNDIKKQHSNLSFEEIIKQMGEMDSLNEIIETMTSDSNVENDIFDYLTPEKNGYDYDDNSFTDELFKYMEARIQNNLETSASDNKQKNHIDEYGQAIRTENEPTLTPHFFEDGTYFVNTSESEVVLYTKEGEQFDLVKLTTLDDYKFHPKFGLESVIIEDKNKNSINAQIMSLTYSKECYLKILRKPDNSIEVKFVYPWSGGENHKKISAPGLKGIVYALKNFSRDIDNPKNKEKNSRKNNHERVYGSTNRAAQLRKWLRNIEYKMSEGGTTLDDIIFFVDDKKMNKEELSAYIKDEKNKISTLNFSEEERDYLDKYFKKKLEERLNAEFGINSKKKKQDKLEIKPEPPVKIDQEKNKTEPQEPKLEKTHLPYPVRGYTQANMDGSKIIELIHRTPNIFPTIRVGDTYTLENGERVEVMEIHTNDEVDEQDKVIKIKKSSDNSELFVKPDDLEQVN